MFFLNRWVGRWILKGGGGIFFNVKYSIDINIKYFIKNLLMKFYESR